MKTQESAITEAQVTRQVERVVASPIFARAVRSQQFLRYLVAAALVDPPQTVKEYAIATDVFDRGAGYDPAIDATVRVEAGRLRARLREYYGEEGQGDPLLIELPKGSYRVVLTVRAEPEKPAGVSHPAIPAPTGGEALAQHAAAPENLESGADAGSGRQPDLPPTVPLGWMRAARARRWLAHYLPRRYGLPALLGLGLLIGAAAWRLSTPQRYQPAIRSIAVLPLKNLSGDPQQDYVADGTTDELITELARIPELRVVSWNSVMQEKGTTKSLKTISRELRADALVEGSVDRSGEIVRINAQLIDARTDHLLWAHSFQGLAGDTMALENKAAQQIVAHTRVKVEPNAVLASASTSPNAIPPAAQEAYLRARNYFDKRQGRASVQEFRRAIDLDPTYASAYTGLAVALESEAFLGEELPGRVIPEAMAAAERSLELNPENGGALIARGSIELNFLWKWEAAKRDLTRGVELSPNNSFGHMMLSVYLDALGQKDKAIRQMQDAVAVDPLSFFMARHLGSTLFYARRYDDALRQLEYAREMHPASAAVVDAWISAAYQKKGRLSDAIRYDLMQAKEDNPKTDVQELLSTYQKQGWQAYWALRLKQLRSEKSLNPCYEYYVGIDATQAGLRDQAIAALKIATRQHCYWMVEARTEPVFDTLRDDPGFKAVVASLHLPVKP